ncbi:hypothetical protein KLP40_19440 [Hymenobacter sp. NST-14]|uniref:hypothetical protein n=1 Tax=Hymenobacter piscis TaxID=2839984 RepID=UPI001C0151E9|nr:hypothetical protein [Hymenobacter piscis]MBT9395350.1 hypothetical protein [Hymenobacter piscis]
MDNTVVTTVNIVLSLLYTAAVIWGAVFLKKQVDQLKEQVNSQKELLNNSKTYFEIFDLNKIKEYAKLTEENERLKGEKKLEELSKQIQEKEEQARLLATKHEALEQENEALEKRKDRLEQTLSGFEERMRDVEARTRFPQFYNIRPSSGWERDKGSSFGEDVRNIVCKYMDEHYPHGSPSPSALDVEDDLEAYVLANNSFYRDYHNRDSEAKESHMVRFASQKIIRGWAIDYVEIRKILNRPSL